MTIFEHLLAVTLIIGTFFYFARNLYMATEYYDKLRSTEWIYRYGYRSRLECFLQVIPVIILGVWFEVYYNVISYRNTRRR